MYYLGHPLIRDAWQWQEDETCVYRDYHLGLRQRFWDGNNQKTDSLSYAMPNQTPIPNSTGLGLDISDLRDKAKKNLREEKEEPRLKRRRALFTCDADAENSAPMDTWSENLDWNPTSSDEGFLFSNEVLDQPLDEWLDNYLNDSEMSSSKSEQIKPIIDVSDFLNGEPDTVTTAFPKPINSATLKISRGVISPTNYKTRLSSSVAIPFTFIKPCEARGHSTLEDINQRIHAPPMKPRIEMHNDTAVGYSTSPFSGKPVIVKTKILTEGGKGSITVLRTKG
ncbi:protein XRI1-like isoform X2 [Zingiber officinale]|uniref:protein XRI1-like isoform X2 n=2 Tax=Zingiber officinale TaxID=94328 RepID=UPI001C4A77A6|nr:protein XRI1-like isoform X2 [Zingiber officinale]